MGEECYLSIGQYQKLAEKLIRRFAHKKFLKSEDDISSIMHAMMKADARFDGRGSRKGYRVRNGKYAVLNLFRFKKNQNIQLDKTFNTKYGECSFGQLIPSDQLSVEDKVFCKQIIEYVDESSYFSDNEKKIIRLRFVENATMSAIGEELNISKQRVQILLDSAIQKLRWRFHGE